MVFRVNHELWEKVFLILVNPSEPVVVRNILHTGNRSHLVPVGHGHDLHQPDSADDHQPVCACNINPPVESAVHHRQERKKHQRNGERPDRENQTNFLPKQISED